MIRLTGLIGIVGIVGLAYLFSTNRKAVRLRTLAWGLGLQLLFAVIVLRWTFGQRIMSAAGDGVTKLLGYSAAGAQFVFGSLGIPAPPVGFVFAFQVLPTIIFISAFFALLYYIGLMQLIIRFFAWLMKLTMGVSGVESLNVAASIFMGQTEAPLTIRPFLPECTRSELMTIMTAGMAHVSGGIMAAYIAFGVEAKHLLAAVIMTAPGTILMAKLLVPETEMPKTQGKVEMSEEDMHKDDNVLGAIARGTIDGGQLAFNVAIMLISFLALIALINGIFGGIHRHAAFFPVSLESLLGHIFAPVAYAIGIPWHDAISVGNLLGTRMVINELVAYQALGAVKAALDPRSVTIATFALCGFANFSSIGIQIGGIGALAPNKRSELAKLGFRAMLAGTMANLMSASIVSLLVQH
ncbi:MAG TPA: nucleoside transporter C-terminal domain-containing protein [Candidatus Sulfotelmatobacter sp.]|nr:nucleoside transporter C-terminal domain-containing protein [Terriglobales bacterium]HKT87959.1 nucleoside transporter C-terminal domain-containing protein [Candidatus Sulfotelmatobacter sp.]